MIKLNATDLVNKRQQLLDTKLGNDYENAIITIHNYFEDENSLLVDIPSLTISPAYLVNKIRIQKELVEHGFLVSEHSDNRLTIRLPLDSLEVLDVASEEPVEIEIVTEAPKEEVKPQVVIKPLQYNHTDLQMSGGDPF